MKNEELRARHSHSFRFALLKCETQYNSTFIILNYNVLRCGTTTRQYANRLTANRLKTVRAANIVDMRFALDISKAIGYIADGNSICLLKQTRKGGAAAAEPLNE